MAKRSASYSSHSAGGPFGGYLYQLEFALLALFELKPGEYLGIETIDDVAKGSPGEQTRYQLKNQSSENGKKLTDSSPELWQTLGIWAQEIHKGITPLTSLRDLILITPAKIASNSMLAVIAKGEHRHNPEKTKELADWLCTASPSLNKKVQWAFNAVRSFASENRDDFDTFVRKLVIKSEQPHLSSYSNELKKRLRSRGFPEKRFQTIEEDLRGWLNSLVSQRLTPSTGVKVTEEEFYARHCQLHSLWNAKELPIYQTEMAWDNLDDVKLALQQSKKYILQLECVGTEEEEKKNAMVHYLQASEIRTNWIKNGDITPKELEFYNHELITTWQHAFRKMCDEVTVNHKDPQLVGRTLFRDLMIHSHRPIRDGWVYNYLAWGSYHMLADDLYVGWHPDFRQLFSNDVEQR